MKFSLSIDKEIPQDSRLIFPISMNQSYHLGERLEVLIAFAEQYNSTVLIADELQRHNLKNDQKKAIKQGDDFIRKHIRIFERAVEVKTVEEWNREKNSKNLKMIRWRNWREIKRVEFDQARRKIECEYNKEEAFFDSVRETANQSLSAVSIESSIEYQKEEIAYLLTFFEFSIHVYPRELNPSQILAKNIFSSEKIPEFLTPTIGKKILQFQVGNNFFGKPVDEEGGALVSSVRNMTIKNLADALSSPEISTDHKRVLADKLNKVLECYLNSSLVVSNNNF